MGFVVTIAAVIDLPNIATETAVEKPSRIEDVRVGRVVVGGFLS